MPTAAITNFSNSEPLTDSLKRLNTQIREITTSSGHDMIGREQVFAINAIELPTNGIAHLFYKLVIYVKDDAPTNIPTEGILIEQFVEWYTIETSAGEEVVRITGDEFYKIARRALNYLQQPDSITDLKKRGMREIAVMGRLPLPNNIYDIQKLLISPTPELTLKMKTRDLRQAMPQGRNHTNALNLLKNMSSSKSSIVVYDQLVNESMVGSEDYAYWPNLLRVKELEYEVPADVRSDGLVFNLGSSNYPQSIWLSEYKDDTTSNKTTLVGKFSASINGIVFYELDDIRDGALYNWYKTNDNSFIYYIGPANLRTKSLAMTNFDPSNKGNSGNVVLRISKKQNTIGKYKITVIYNSD